MVRTMIFMVLFITLILGEGLTFLLACDSVRIKDSVNLKQKLSTINIASPQTSRKMGLILATKFAKMARKRNISGDPIISPANLITALSILSEGIKIKSRCGTKLRNILYGKNSKNSKTSLKFLSKFKNYSKSGYEVKMGNRIFLKSGNRLVPGLMKKLRKYHVLIENLDFKNLAGDRKYINKLISNDTKNLIPKILSDDQPNMDTELMSINYLYFKGLWETPFEKENKKGIFEREDGSSVYIEYMSKRIDLKVNSLNPFNADVFLINYVVPNFKFVIIKPREGIKLRDIEDILFATPKFLATSIKNAHNDTNKVIIPKIDTKHEIDMEDGLRSSGLSCLFNSNIDNMISNKSLAVSSIMQKIKFEANEKGTEGAAATNTEIVLRFGSDPYIMNVPFIYLVWNEEFEEILFWGRFAHPLNP